MSMQKICVLSLIFLIALTADITAFHGCTYVNSSIGWGQVFIGGFLQFIGFFLLISVFKKADKVEEDLIPSDYRKYGLFRSKWYYVTLLILAGCMVFARGLNHSNLDEGFKLGEKWWSCPNPKSS
jgi:hypothetical protein